MRSFIKKDSPIVAYGSLLAIAASWFMIALAAEEFSKANFDLGETGNRSVGIATLIAGLTGTTFAMDKKGGTRYWA